MKPPIDKLISHGARAHQLKNCPVCNSHLDKDDVPSVTKAWWQLVWDCKSYSELVQKLEQENMLLSAKVGLLESLLNKNNTKGDN